MNDFEIDKARFGQFLAEERKRRGLTQKELAQRLFLSDKAVSKWERGLSLPDISALMPLSEILGVTVTELLEGRRIENAEEMDAQQVESLLKKAIGMSEEQSKPSREQRRKNALIFLAGVLALALETALYFLSGHDSQALMEDAVLSTGLMLSPMALLFGVYFWFFMPQRLPKYYDENKISAYSNGIVRFNMAGVYFNNKNWPHIVKALRLWSLLAAILCPPVLYGLSVLAPGLWQKAGLYIYLALFLGGLFVPIYVLGKKYGD